MIYALALLTAAVFVSAPTWANDDDEHDRVRRARERGEILPLVDILDRAQQAYPGQVIEAEFDDEHGRLVYELVVLADDGRVLKLYYDARTGKLLKMKGRKRHE